MAKMLGSEVPRIFTPPLRELTPETSLGFLMIQFVEEVLGIGMLPWQRWLAIHALELIDTEDSFGRPVQLFRFRVVTVEVARQQGKTEFSKMLVLFFMFMLDAKWVVGTAQDVSIAKKIWAEVVGVVEGVDELREELVGKPRTTNGQIELTLISDRHYVVKPSTSGGARGISSDLVLMDELRMHRDFEAFAALQATTMARPNGQVWAFSNAGDARSVVLRHQRMQAHKALGDPDGIFEDQDADALVDDDTELEDVAAGWFEWSAPPDAGPFDREFWPLMAPSLGYGFVTERSLASNLASAPPAVQRMEYMCQWVDGSATGPFYPGSWEATTLDENVKIADQRRDVCVHMSYDRSKAFIAAAGEDAEGRTIMTIAQAMLTTDGAGIRAWLEANADRIRQVTGQWNGSTISPYLQEWDGDPTFRIPIVRWEGINLTAAFGQAYDAIRDTAGAVKSGDPLPTAAVWHTPQAALDQAASAGDKKTLQGGWVLDDRSKVDVAPLTACVGALWLHRRPTPVRMAIPAAAKPVRDAPVAQSSPHRRAGRRSSSTEISTADLATISF